PVILEPVSRLEVIVPLDLQGDVMGDLNSRRGRVQGTDTAGDGRQTIIALVPTSAIQRYAIGLRSLTGGGGKGHATAADVRQTIIALVPTSEIQRYAIELRSLTGGRGRFHAAFDHYDVLPGHLVDAIKRE